MATFEELEAAWRSSPPSPRDRGAVRLICVRTGGGLHERPERVHVTPERGVEGDRWAGDAARDPECLVTLMNARVAELVTTGRVPLDAPGDNFLVDLDLSEDALPAGTRLRLGGAVLEVSAQPHTGCRKFRDRTGAEALAWINDRSNRHLRLRGVNCRVVAPGWVALADPIERIPGEATGGSQAFTRAGRGPSSGTS